MIRKHNGIKGIVLNDKEYKLSQYADDTQVFLDGTEISLRNSLETLNAFYLMSGLKLNIDKTKAIWIGSTSKSNSRLCCDYNLDSNQEPIKILGVTFTSEVFDIWGKNANEIFKKVEKTIKSWSKRKLTLLGKITVIKSLAMSKFAHLFMALPNPPGTLIKRLNQLFYSFFMELRTGQNQKKVYRERYSKRGVKNDSYRCFHCCIKNNLAEAVHSTTQ